MKRRGSHARMVGGEAVLVSPLFSNRWRLLQGDKELARLVRFPHHRMSVAQLPDGTEWRIEPDGWGRVRLLEDGDEVGHVVRRSWLGRRFDLQSAQFGLQLISRPLPRRWALAIGSEPMAFLAGSLWNYNKLRLDAPLAVPLAAVVLAWQVVVRPWEAAAYPLALRPGPIRPPARTAEADAERRRQ